MMIYRIYPLNASGLRSPGQDVACLSDHDAVRFAQTLVQGEDQAEIWHASRLVGTVCVMIAVLAPPLARMPAPEIALNRNIAGKSEFRRNVPVNVSWPD